MTKDEALRLALEALDSVLANHKGAPVLPWIEARDAVKATLEAKDDGITLTTIRHPRGKPALGDLNPKLLETVEIDLPEPVAWGVFEGNLHDMFFTQSEAQEMADLKGTHAEVRPLYTTPPQRTWVGLTDEDEIDWEEGGNLRDLVKAIEAKLKEKNT
jgi:hypothetical protein